MARAVGILPTVLWRDERNAHNARIRGQDALATKTLMAKSLTQHSRIVSAMTLISRVTGLARQILLAAWLGRGWLQDSFVFAFTIPNLFRNLLGEGALASSFVPVFAEKLIDNDNTSARRLLGKAASALTAILATLTFIGVVGLLIAAVVAEDHARRILLLLTALMFPYVIAACLSALLAAVLNCRERFALPAFMPVLLNVFQIAVMGFMFAGGERLTGGRTTAVFIVTLAVLAAGVAQIWLLQRAVNRQGLHWHFQRDWRDPDVGRIIRMMGPMLIALGILQFATILDNIIIIALTAPEGRSVFTFWDHSIAFPFIAGAMTAVFQARLLYQLPLGVLGNALATVAFPAMSRLAAAGNRRELGQTVGHTLELALVQAIPAGAGLFVMSDLIVSVIFQHGHYDAVGAAQAAHVLRFYCLGMPAYFAHQVLLRAFYSLQDTLTPLKTLVKLVPLGIIMNLTLIWWKPIGTAAFGLSTSVVITLNVLMLAQMLAQRLEDLNLRHLLLTACKILIATSVMVAALIIGRNYLPIENRYVLAVVLLAIGLICYFAAARLLRLQAVSELLRRKPL
ncbi:MAG: murein biosynthesis integral membrane protein MurJ [Sedimentisphaerales bacterium]|nr:murein biosynthesis integral membrane protein MurJ [Sedimentisphaerales bacterium]